MLKNKQNQLRETISELQDSIDYIDWKQNLYDESNLISGDNKA